MLPSLEYKLETECVGVNTTAVFPAFPTGTGVVGGATGKVTGASARLGATATGSSSGSNSGAKRFSASLGLVSGTISLVILGGVLG